MYTIVDPDGRESGPVDLPTLRGWVAGGRVQPHTTVVDAATAERRAAGTMPDLEAAFHPLFPQPAPVVSASPPPTNLVACPVCSRPVSPQAVNCPQCGHPLKTVTPPVDNWEQIKRVGMVVSILIILLTLGVQAAFLKVVGAAGMGEDGAAALLKVFLQSAPFTVAVAIIGLAAMNKWVDEFGCFIGLAGATLFASIFVSGLLGGWRQLPRIEGNVFVMIFQIVAFYWKYYGPSLFLSSLILGAFLAWVLTKLWPRPAAPKPASVGVGK